MKNNNNKLNAFSVIKALFLSLMVLTPSLLMALPSVASTNLQTTTGVSVQSTPSSLTFSAPDKAILTWNNFGSGTDHISGGDVIQYNLPNSNAAILNVVAGYNATAINGTINSNGNVFIVNPNGIVVGPNGRIDTNSVYLSASDNPFAATFSFLNTGKLPSQTGQKTAAGSVTVQPNAIINSISGNITISSKDVDIQGGIFNKNLIIDADGSVVLSSSGITLVSGTTSIVSSNGNVMLGGNGSLFNGSDSLTVVTKNGSISNTAQSNTNVKTASFDAGQNDVNVSKVSASSISATGNNVTLSIGPSFDTSVSVNAGNNISISSPINLSVTSLTNSGSGNTNVTAVGRIALGNVHLNSSGSTSFTGTSIVDTQNGMFVYGPTSFNAVAGEVNVTKSNHSFGPLSVSATGNAVVYEAAATNLNKVAVLNLTLRTGESFFQTPLTASLITNKFNLTSFGNASFYTGSIKDGLTITANGVADLGLLSLSSNLNGIAPVVNALFKRDPLP